MRRTPKISIIELIADSSLTGAPKHLLTLLENINRNKFIPAVICPPGPLASQLKKLRVPVFQVPMNGLADVNAVYAVRKIIAKYEPDIVHTHGQRAGWIGRFANRGLHTKTVHTEHTFTNELRYKNTAWQWTHVQGMSFLDLFTHHTIAVSDAVRDFLVHSRVAKPSKITTIYNGIDPHFKRPSSATLQLLRKKYSLSPTDIIIGSVGSLIPSKGQDHLVRAFAKVAAKWPKSKLVLVGSGPRLQVLQDLAAKLGVSDKVVFTGSIEDVLSLMSLFHLFAFPSLSEPFGIVLLEAMKVGIPIVASKVGGIPEIITNNYNGLLVPPADSKSLAAAMSKILNDKKLRSKLVAHHRQVLKKFAASHMAQQTEALFASLVTK